MLKHSTALTFIFYFLTHTLSFCMEHEKSLWNPETVIGVGGALVGIKLMHDGLQKIFNPNKQSFSFAQWKIFDGSLRATQDVSLNFPQATTAPKKFKIEFKRLNAEETSSEFKEGIVLFGFGWVGTLASIYWIQKNR